MSRNRQAGRRQVHGAERTVTPLYHQVYVILRQKIRDGEFQPDRPLPGENVLADNFGVSRVTIRKALHNLEVDGFVIKRPSIGNFPARQPAGFPDRYNVGRLAESSAGTDASTRMTTLSIEPVSPPAPVRDRLKLGAVGDTDEPSVLRLVRLRSIRGEPFTLMTAWFAPEYTAQLDHQALRKLPPPTALEMTGVSLSGAEQSISARNADVTVAPLLNVPIGSALICMSTVFYTRQDHPVIALESLYRPDLYEYRSTMRRTRSGEWRE